MRYRDLGNTGIRVSQLGFGMWPIGGTQHAGDYGKVDDLEAVAAIHRALELGVNLFDTAPAYGNGKAESLLGKALVSRRHEAVIVTKCAVHWDYQAENWVTTSNREAILTSANESLRRIGTDYIDVLLIHVPDPTGSPEGSMGAFRELVDVGKVRAVGVSNFTIDQIADYNKFGNVQVQQLGYNLIDRRIEAKTMLHLSNLGIGLMTYGSLCHGLFSGTWTSETTFPAKDWRSRGDVFGLPLFVGNNFKQNVSIAQRLQAFAISRGQTLAQLAIAWVVQHINVATCLAGMVSVAEVEDNVAGVEWDLSASDLHEIEKITADAAGIHGEDHYVVG